MCGRTAYSATSTAAAARELSHEIGKNCNGENNEAILHITREEETHNRRSNSTPGQSYHIFCRSSKSRKEDANILVDDTDSNKDLQELLEQLIGQQ